MNLELAKATLLEHARSKKNGWFPERITFQGQLTNPLCGDHVLIKGRVESQVITHLGFSAQACAICTASASLLCKELQGVSTRKALEVGYLFEKNIAARPEAPWPAELQGFQSFQHLRMNPARRTCAMLVHIILRNTLKENQL